MDVSDAPRLGPSFGIRCPEGRKSARYHVVAPTPPEGPIARRFRLRANDVITMQAAVAKNPSAMTRGAVSVSLTGAMATH